MPKADNSPLRCPKCNEPMRLVTDAPHFAQFLPWRSFTCELCHIGLSYHPDEKDGLVGFDEKSSALSRGASKQG